MKKHFRKIPGFILMKSRNINSDSQIVSTTIVWGEKDINTSLSRNLGLSIKNGELFYQTEFIPFSEKGKYSKRNTLGYTIIRKDLPKVMKTIDCGERPYFGNWDKGSFTLLVTRKVYKRDRIPAKELTIRIELLETSVVNNEKRFTIKVSVYEILNRTSSDFLDNLLFNINLLQENVYKVDIFDTEATIEDYIKSCHVSWDFFPPGNRDSDIAKILSGYKNPSEEIQKQLQERYDFLRTLKPKDFIYGLSGIRRYFGARFAENLVVFDNLQYGNAIYVLFENWEALSKLSRTQIQKRSEGDFEYIIHSNGWKNLLKRTIEKRLIAN
jgi:hypothetical protein